MTHRLFIEFLAAEGAVKRMLGLIERRGFILRRISMAELPDGRRASLALEVEARDPGRSIETLSRQVERLHGVTGITHQRGFTATEQAA